MNLRFSNKILFIFFVIFIFNGIALATEKNTILLNNTNKEPFTTEKRDGFLDIILAQAFLRIGYQLKTVRLPPERGLISANDGIVDGEVNRIAGLDLVYKNLLRVSEKIRDSEFCAFSKNADIMNTPDELRKRIVGHIKGWKVYDKMMQGVQNVITANSPEQLFRLLNINRIEVALYSCVEGLDLLNRLKIKAVYILKPAFKQVPMYVYLNKRYNFLLSKLSKALVDIKKEGLYDRLYREKILPYYNKQ